MKTTFTIAAVTLFSLATFGASAAVQQVNKAQAQNLQPMGSVSVTQITGAPMDVRQKLAQKAEQQGASSYRITELTQGDHWHATAELYK